MEKIILYTDGSCSPNPGKGGWGFIGLINDIEIWVNGGEKQTTNNIMELTAVLEGIKEFKQYRCFDIYTDSQYVINCSSGKWKRNKNIDLWSEYDKITNGKKINFFWVKGHNGNKYNELVDQLAKKGCE